MSEHRQVVIIGGTLAAAVDRRGLGSAELAPAFYKAAAKIIANPWAIAAGGDFCFAATTGEKPPMVGLINRYALIKPRLFGKVRRGAARQR